MLRLLRNALTEDHQNFNFFEGSEVIEEYLPQNTVIGVVATFEPLDDEDKLLVRKSAVEHIVRVCRRDGKAGIVTGHLIFWDGRGEVSKEVMNDADLQAFTHILYLHNAPQETAGHREGDESRKRAGM